MVCVTHGMHSSTSSGANNYEIVSISANTIGPHNPWEAPFIILVPRDATPPLLFLVLGFNPPPHHVVRLMVLIKLKEAPQLTEEIHLTTDTVQNLALKPSSGCSVLGSRSVITFLDL